MPTSEKEIAVGEQAERKRDRFGGFGKFPEPGERGAAGGEDDGDGDGRGDPGVGKGHGAGGEEKIPERSDKKELAHGGERPDAGERAEEEKAAGEKAGRDHPALVIDVRANGVVAQADESEGVDEIKPDDPRAIAV